MKTIRLDVNTSRNDSRIYKRLPIGMIVGQVLAESGNLGTNSWPLYNVNWCSSQERTYLPRNAASWQPG